MDKRIRSYLISTFYALGISVNDTVALLGWSKKIIQYNVQKAGGAKAFPMRPKHPFKDVFERYIQLELLEENDEQQQQLHRALASWLKVDVILEFVLGLLFAQQQSTLVVLGEKDQQYFRLLEWLGFWQFTTKNRKYQSSSMLTHMPYEGDVWRNFLRAGLSGEYRFPSSQEALRDRLTLFVDASFGRSEVALPVADGRIAESVLAALSTLNQWQRMFVENKFLGGKHELDFLTQERKTQLEVQIMRKLRHPDACRGITENIVTLGCISPEMLQKVLPQ